LVRPAVPPVRPEFDEHCAFNDADPQPAFRSAIRCFGPLSKRLECSRVLARCEYCLASRSRMGAPTSNREFHFGDPCVDATNRVASSEPGKFAACTTKGPVGCRFQNSWRRTD
jgi:hypothetical protein